MSGATQRHAPSLEGGGQGGGDAAGDDLPSSQMDDNYNPKSKGQDIKLNIWEKLIVRRKKKFMYIFKLLD